MAGRDRDSDGDIQQKDWLAIQKDPEAQRRSN
jgi:hypothetical protein